VVATTCKCRGSEIELTNALAYLVASGQVDVFIDDSDGEIKFQYITGGCNE